MTLETSTVHSSSRRVLQIAVKVSKWTGFQSQAFSQTISAVFAETCSITAHGFTVTRTCDHGCCDTECCEKPFWNWYIIVAVVVAGVFLLIFIVGTIIFLYVHCIKTKESPRTRRSARRVDPVWNTSYHPPPNFLQTRPPPYSENDPPPNYEESQSQRGMITQQQSSTAFT